ncbi:MAG: sulfite exporter TauE/SafE family protein [Thaumarchaeota archaeon]|nr:sulfite exporter TauE/SafE family protein [Candidatus Wolframiiraptor allenii]
MIEALIYLIILILLGLLAGFLGAMLGLGGGFIIVPALMLLAGFDAHHAIGTSMAAILFTGFPAAFAYQRQGRLDWKLALVAETTTMPGSFLGAVFTGLIAPDPLKTIFSIFLIALALSMILRKNSQASGEVIGRGDGVAVWRRVLRDSRGEVFTYSVDLLKLLPASFLAGIVSGFFGVGGGTIKVPVLYHLGTPIHVAVATSTLMIALTAISGTIGHLLLGHVRLIELFALAPGIIAGTQLGASIARRAKSQMLRIIFSIALIIIAVILFMR